MSKQRSGRKKKVHEQQRETTRNEEDGEEEEDEGPGASECVLLRGIFKLGKKSHDVLLTRTRLSWTPIVPETPTGEACVLQPGFLMLQDVYAVKVKRRRAVGQQSGGPVLGVALFYSKRCGRRLEEDTLHLHNASAEHTHTWFNTVKELLKGFSTRPSYVKVLINPRSHKKEAVHIYREHVASLFKMADLRTDITVTERKGHALSVMKECKLEEYDGVVCVGGDGFVAELCHALVLRAQMDANSPEDPVTSVLPLGIIPAGSTDVISCSVHGVRDPVTAALHIVLGRVGPFILAFIGHLQQVDMCSFTSLGQPVHYGFSGMFGFGGRSLARAEKKRWMPSSRRREYALMKTLAKLRPEECQLSFLPAKKPNGNKLGRQHRDQDQIRDQDAGSGVEETWTTNQGLYLNISVMSIPCLSPHAPRGLAPNTSSADGSASLIAVGNTSRSEFVKHLKRYNSSSGQLNFSFVEAHNVSAVKIRPLSHVSWSEEESEAEGDSRTVPIIQSERAAFPWNIDGELVEIAHEVHIKVHPRLITLYGEEVDEVESAVSCSCI